MCEYYNHNNNNYYFTGPPDHQPHLIAVAIKCEPRGLGPMVPNHPRHAVAVQQDEAVVRVDKEDDLIFVAASSSTSLS